MKGIRVTYSTATSHSDTTACAAPPAQALPRDSVRGQNPKGRSVPQRTACAASSAQVLGVSASASCGAHTHKQKDNSNGFESSEVNRRYRD